MASLTILIADDHPEIRDRLFVLLKSIPDFEVVGEAATGEEVVARAAALRPDVILLDIKLLSSRGITSMREILHTSPNSRLLVMTPMDDDSIFAALRAGARGYISKNSDEGKIVRVIRAVGNNEAIFSPTIAGRVLEYFSVARSSAPKGAFPSLTEREREILILMAIGNNNLGIARQLSLSTKTVSHYISNIYDKLQVVDRTQAIICARNAGIK